MTRPVSGAGSCQRIATTRRSAGFTWKLVAAVLADDHPREVCRASGRLTKPSRPRHGLRLSAVRGGEKETVAHS